MPANCVIIANYAEEVYFSPIMDILKSKTKNTDFTEGEVRPIMKQNDDPKEAPMRALSTLSRKGQTVIPAEIRHKLGAEQGDQIIFTVADDDTVTLQVVKRKRLASLVGILAATRNYQDPSEYRKYVYATKSQLRYPEDIRE